MGILLFLGGDTPSARAGTNLKLSSNSWNSVQIYDIATQKWYNQTTTGSVPARTQFCATVHKDEATSSYAIYVLGGVDLQSENVLTDVSYLTVPSFTWHSAGPLRERRMSHSCASYGSQIFGIGGRLEWTSTGGGICYNMPAFLYDTQSEANVSNFDPTRVSYSLPNSTLKQVKESPYSISWADPSLESLFVAKNTTSSDSPNNSSNKTVPKTSGNIGTIVGAVIGGVVGVALIVCATVLFLRRRRKQLVENEKSLYNRHGELRLSSIAEIQTTEPRTELDGHAPLVFELDGASGK